MILLFYTIMIVIDYRHNALNIYVFFLWEGYLKYLGPLIIFTDI